jgi:XPG I-region
MHSKCRYTPCSQSCNLCLPDSSFSHSVACVVVHGRLGPASMHLQCFDSWQGLPVMRAPGEAEATAAALSLAGNVDAVASRDGDALLFGAQTVLKEAKLHVRVCGSRLLLQSADAIDLVAVGCQNWPALLCLYHFFCNYQLTGW